MQKLATLLLFLFVITSVSAQLDTNDFVTTWKTDNPGSSNDSSVTIFIDQGLAYNYDVDWNNDGIFDSLAVTGNITHTYPSLGTYTIRIRGLFPSIKFGGQGGDKNKIISIDQWGNIQFIDLEKAFYQCSNLGYTATDKPNIGSNCNASYMFSFATSFNGDIGNWNVSSITKMHWMFYFAQSFNQNIGNWDVSSVTRMDYMFTDATSFNQNLNSWNVSSVTNMSHMFEGATSFNQSLNNWDVSSVTDMGSMFHACINFSGNFNNWDVSLVTNMRNMFNNTSGPCCMNNWDVSSVTNMYGMFDGSFWFNEDLSSWDVSSVTNMGNMFETTQFNRDISNWDVSSVTNMQRMFYNTGFNQNLGDWDISSVTNMTSMFIGGSNGLGRYGLSTANYDSTLISWQAKPHQLNVPIGVQGLEYCLSDSARALLIADGWVFTGDSLDCFGVSIEEEHLKNEFSIYPNPTNGIVNIELNEAIENQDVIILNALGQAKKPVAVIGEKPIQMDLSDFPKGLYYVKYNNRVIKLVLGE